MWLAESMRTGYHMEERSNLLKDTGAEQGLQICQNA